MRLRGGTGRRLTRRVKWRMRVRTSSGQLRSYYDTPGRKVGVARSAPPGSYAELRLDARLRVCVPRVPRG